MGHRHVSNPYSISEIDQHDNNHTVVEQSYIHMQGRVVAPENGPFVGPVDHMLRGGVHSESRWNSEGRTNEYPSSNVNMEVQRFTPVFPGPPVDSYPHISLNGNTSLVPVTTVGHVHPTHYNVPNIREVEGGPINSSTGIRGPFKRKSLNTSGSCERDSSSSFYGAGSSSSSSQMQMEKPPVDCHNIPPYRGPGLSISGENLPRNVRSRSRHEMENNLTRTHVPNYSSHHYQSTAHPANFSAPVHPGNLNADSTSREWNCVPHYVASSHGRISPPDINCSRHQTSQFHVGGSSTDIDGCHRDSAFSRHPVSSPQYLHGPPQSRREGHSNHSRRVTPSYRSCPSYSHYAHGGSSSTNGLPLPSGSSSSRYSRHCSGGGWRSNFRSGRSRISVDRFQPIVDVMDGHGRMGQEAMMMVDRGSFYGNSRNMFDQHRDMRLDIDSMSYEELLALEERIGNVSTGLSEDSLSKCLREQVFCSSDQKHEEVACPICLEEYKSGEKIGSMEKCGHGYHADCIKKWLVMKKLCPICKSECSTQEA